MPKRKHPTHHQLPPTDPEPPKCPDMVNQQDSESSTTKPPQSPPTVPPETGG